MKVSDQVANEMLILTLLNSVSVFTNFVTRKRDKQKTNKNVTLFRLQLARKARSPPHLAW